MAHYHITENDLRELGAGHHLVVETLINEGRFPEGWVAGYCAFLTETLANNGAARFWAWRLLQAVHFVSFHLRYRYGVWRSCQQIANPETELLLGQIQLESELFLWDSVYGVPLVIDPRDHSEEQEVDAGDVTLVKLCFENNAVFLSGDCAGNSLIEMWQHDYRAALSAIRAKWRLRPHVWKWLALAVRFTSFYLDLASVPDEAQRHYEDQQGQQPQRIRETVRRLETQISNRAVIRVIDLWLRHSHLPRDSSGLPSVFSSALSGRRPVGVRIASEAFLQADPDS